MFLTCRALVYPYERHDRGYSVIRQRGLLHTIQRYIYLSRGGPPALPAAPRDPCPPPSPHSKQPTREQRHAPLGRRTRTHHILPPLEFPRMEFANYYYNHREQHPRLGGTQPLAPPEPWPQRGLGPQGVGPCSVAGVKCAVTWVGVSCAGLPRS